VVKPEDDVDVVVLEINREKQEISLGLKQTGANPWDEVEGRYPPGTKVSGVVRNLTNYGAFVELEEGIDGLLHVSDMSWTKKIAHPSEVYEKDDVVEAVVLSVDQERKRVALGTKQLQSDPWESEIPSKFKAEDEITGTVTKLTNFGAFVEIAPGVEGLLHVSEMTTEPDKNPEDLVSQGDEVKVRVLRVEQEERKIGLSMIEPGERPDPPAEEAPAEEAPAEESPAEEAPAEEAPAEEAPAEEAPAEEASAEEPPAEESPAEEAPAEEPPAEESPAEEPPAEEAPAEEAPVEETPDA
jgi:small subunit ribosomal protein S1